MAKFEIGKEIYNSDIPHLIRANCKAEFSGRICYALDISLFDCIKTITYHTEEDQIIDLFTDDLLNVLDALSDNAFSLCYGNVVVRGVISFYKKNIPSFYFRFYESDNADECFKFIDGIEIKPEEMELLYDLTQKYFENEKLALPIKRLTIEERILHDMKNALRFEQFSFSPREIDRILPILAKDVVRYVKEDTNYSDYELLTCEEVNSVICKAIIDHLV